MDGGTERGVITNEKGIYLREMGNQLFYAAEM